MIHCQCHIYNKVQLFTFWGPWQPDVRQGVPDDSAFSSLQAVPVESTNDAMPKAYLIASYNIDENGKYKSVTATTHKDKSIRTLELIAPWEIVLPDSHKNIN